jgi:uncharacterized protein
MLLNNGLRLAGLRERCLPHSKCGNFLHSEDEKMELSSIRMQIPDGANLILGHSHFIKTAEDLYEAVVNTVPGAKFAVAFNEASGPCLVRVESNDDELRAAAIANAQALAAGHAFVLLIRQAYPINLLSRIRDSFEVCSIFCATANPVEVIVAGTEQGRGVLGVIDGSSPKGVETEEDVKVRREFLRRIGYKL